MRDFDRDVKEEVIVSASPILKRSPNTSPIDPLSTIGAILAGPVTPPIGAILTPPPIQNNSANKNGDKK